MTTFINFLEKTKVGKYAILVSMDVSSLYTNISPEGGTNIVCEAFKKFNSHNAPISTQYLREMSVLILQENSFQYNEVTFLKHIEPLWVRKWWKLKRK